MYSHLFSPLTVNTLTLRNRIAYPSLGLLYSYDTKLNDKYYHFFEEMARGGDEEEQLVIKNYLDIRQTYGKNPMIDARQRASVTRGYVVDGIISDSRGSFISSG